MSSHTVEMYVPADGQFQPTSAHTVSCGPRRARTIADAMLAEPDRYLRGHSRTVSIFDAERRLMEQRRVPDTRVTEPPPVGARRTR